MKRRPNNFGCLVSKGEGKPYLARWMFQRKVYTKSTGETERSRAEKVLEKLTRPFREEKRENVVKNLEILLARVKEDAKVHKKLLVRDIWRVYSPMMWDMNLTESSQKNYEKHITTTAKWLSRKVVYAGDVKRGHVEEYLKSFVDKVSPQTYNTRLMVMRRVWEALSDEYALDVSVWEGFRKRKPEKETKRRDFSPEEIKRILECARGEMKTLVLLGIYTGLRISDCALLKWEDVDLEKGVVDVITMKTKSHVVIPVHRRLREALEGISSREGYVLPMVARWFQNGSLKRKLKEMFDEAGIATYEVVDGRKRIITGFHSFRHTFVSLAINAGINPLVVQKVVGHAALDMTERYLHENREDVERMLGSIPDFG